MSLREQLQAIYDSHKMLTPDLVLAEARVPSHPLHERFEWDDTVAAERWRLEQAHELIRSVRVVYQEGADGKPPKDVRAWQAVRDERGHVYEPADRVATDPLLRKMVLADMERDWRTLKQRYENFQEFWQLLREEVGA
jgi:hypothetical protein